MNVEHSAPKTLEEEINAALKYLSGAQPPAAMASRVHRSLETAAAKPQRSRSSRRFLIPAASAALAALTLFVIFSQTRRTQENQASAIETARLVANTPLAQTTITPPSATTETERSDEGKRSVQYYIKRRSRQSRENRHATNLLSYPLTREEKLLLQFAHHAKPTDLQALNPEYQARVEARQDAEFAAYLKSGSSSDTESATQTKKSTQE